MISVPVFWSQFMTVFYALLVKLPFMTCQKGPV